jgi:alginate O-acetyltransferase complex protein AlgJ
VYVVEGLEAKKKEKDGVLSLDNKEMDTTVSENYKQNNERFAAEAEKHGGYEKWAAEQSSFLDAQKAFLAGLPEEQMGFEGKDDFVFFRKSLEYSTGGDLAEQADDKNAIPHLKDMKSYLNSKDVNMLFVVVPVKSEVYYEKLPVDGAPSDKTTIVNPYSRKILADIQDAGIEVIDLLPAFLAAKAEDGEHDEPVYQKQDTHWTNRGLQIAAEKIAERVKQYAWYDDALSAGKVEFTTVDTTFSRQGDIVDKLPQEAQAKYPAVTLKAEQVKTPEGELNKGSKAGQVMLIGDSFTGVFEHVDCKGAGVGSHIASKTDLPVDIITSWGGGPLVRKKMMRARSKLMDGKRLVVYMMVARDLYDYQMGWQPLQTK